MIYHPNIDPVAVSAFGLSIHWYGITYLCAFVAALWLARKRTVKPWAPLDKDQVDDLIFYGMLGVILGGRLGYVFFYNFDRFLESPMWLFKVNEGGMSFHGGLLGVVVAMLIFSRRHKIAYGDILDFAAPIVPIGLCFGRIGNFIGQELWGREADVPWAMVFQNDPLGLARHPSQLYQAGLEGLALFILLWWFSAKQRPRWAVGGLFLVGYAVFRSIAEFFREPDAHIGFDLFGWLTRGQLLCMPMLLVGLLLIVGAYRRAASQANVSTKG